MYITRHDHCTRNGFHFHVSIREGPAYPPVAGRPANNTEYYQDVETFYGDCCCSLLTRQKAKPESKINEALRHKWQWNALKRTLFLAGQHKKVQSLCSLFYK